MLIGCSPTMFRNAETGATAECTYSGLTPLITKLQCISSLKNQGWVEVTPEEITQAKALQTSLIAKAKICFDQIKTQPQLNIISSKLSLGGADEQTFLMLANTSKPTEEEKTAISVYADMRKNCIKEDIKTRDIDPLAVRQLYASSTGAVENLLVDLYKGNLTYGQFAQLRKEVVASTMAGLVEIDKELKSNAVNANARAEEMAIQRENAFAAMKNATANQTAADALKTQSQKVFLQPVQPQQIISPYQNNTTRCRSYMIGNQMNTDCN